MSSPQIHRREKTESFEGTQMMFEFPRDHQIQSGYIAEEEVRSKNCGDTFSEISSNASGINGSSSNKLVTAVSVSSARDSLQHSEEIFHHQQLTGSNYSLSKLSVTVKSEESPITNTERSSTISLRTAPSQKTLSELVSRSKSIQRFKTNPSIRSQLTMQSRMRDSNLSKQSTLKRSNAIKHKEGWLTRLMQKWVIFRQKMKKWRLIGRKKALNARSHSIKSKPTRNETGVKRNFSLKRSNTIIIQNEPLTQNLINQRDIESMSGQSYEAGTKNLNKYLQKEQQLVNLYNISQDILKETPDLSKTEQEPVIASSQKRNSNVPSTYPTPNVDVYEAQDLEAPDIHKMQMQRLWAHYLRKSIASRIQLKLEISNYKDSRNELLQRSESVSTSEIVYQREPLGIKSTGDARRESVLETIICDYTSEEDSEDDDLMEEEDYQSDGFETDTAHSSATSISSYECDNDQEIATEVLYEQTDETDDVSSIVASIVSSYQSSYYPSRQSSILKRNNSIAVQRQLSVLSKQSNMTYIEDLVNMKTSKPRQDSINTPSNTYGYNMTAPLSPIMPSSTGERRSMSAITRSPSFVVTPKRSNTVLLSVREE